MRILELRFKNLNSLYGQWTIDFTRPEYVQDGIFVITGPTGAGKSTLMDAICLALYGRTPRLKSISKSTNEIMSRQTWECFAEVLFETASGQFRAHWSQRRAHKKSDGNLVESKHEISEAAEGKILASKKRDTAERIVKETGMDFDRFTRSMLLAQGGFAAFLQAAPDERAPILEQITGTDIYSRISKKVHERLSEEKKKLDLLDARMGGIQVLNDEAEAAIRQELEATQAQETRIRKEQDAFAASLAWLLTIDRLEKELAHLDQASQQVQKEQTAFENNRIRLKNGLNAAQIESEFVLLTDRRDQQQKDRTALEGLDSSIPEMEKAFKLKTAALDTARNWLNQAKADQKQQLVLIKEVRKLDLEIHQKVQTCSEIRAECVKIEDKKAKENKVLVQAIKDQEKKKAHFEQISAHLSEHAADEGLLPACGVIREKIYRLNEWLQALDDLKNRIEITRRQLEEESGRHKKQQSVCERIIEKYGFAQKETAQAAEEMKTLLDGRSIKGYRSEYEGLLREMAYKRTIADLEEERLRLVSGKACPLCGAVDHPFAEGRVPKTDETQEKIDTLSGILQSAEALENRLNLLKESETRYEQEIADARNQEKEILYQLERRKDQIQQSEKEVLTVQAKMKESETAVWSALEPFGIQPGTKDRFESVLQSLEARAKRFKQHREHGIQIEKELNGLAARIKQGKDTLGIFDTQLEEKKTALKAGELFLKERSKLRQQIYADKDPDKEETRLETLVAKAAEDEALAVAQTDQIRRQLSTQTARQADLKTAMTYRQSTLDDLEKNFVQKLASSGFKDEAQFISCRLSTEERNALARTAQDLDEKGRDIAARTEDRNEQLEIERAKKLTQLSCDHLEKALETVQTVLKDLGETVGALKHKLSENSRAKVRIRDQITQIAAQKKEYSRWEILHGLVGSADGKKYRNFAQGITFELMVSHANGQLKKMSDRYLLIRDEEQPLELNIVDDYQAGEIRSTKNLSGGESFIVSLSLALGLSNMAGGKVRVDSLFLDEGFGTLDEDALETAMQSLSGLHRSGKLIGVISHVPALKENISTQIRIAPVSGGKSRITGPGVTEKQAHT